jgi:CheY-like chemotaxis protein
MQAGKTILFIDDDKHLARIVSDFLKHEHFDVHTAASAEEGLRLLQTLKPDLIVLDISMPGIGGIGFLKRIANPDGSLQHPVLVLTARAVMKEFFDTVAVDGFLPKPCSELDLIRKIMAIIDSREEHRLRHDTTAPAAGPQRKKIVVGEDDADMCKIYTQTFKDCGFDIFLANTGPEVLEQTVASHPDAIVMKELLPNMNGSVVARLVKTMPHTRLIPVIVHDNTRTTKPPAISIQDVDLFMFSSVAHDLVAAVRQTLA